LNAIVAYALAFFGLLILVVGLGAFITGMFQDTTMKFERLQFTYQFIGENDTQAVAVFVYPYGGLVGGFAPNDYPLSIIVSYSNVNSARALHIEDDFVNYGTYYNWTERDYRDVTGTGTVVFDNIPFSYVGLHFIRIQPNYVPTTPIEINVYAGYYGYTSHQDFIIAGFSLGLVGSLLASIGATQIISLRTSKTEKAESN
jgi:hypothetical protein